MWGPSSNILVICGQRKLEKLKTVSKHLKFCLLSSAVNRILSDGCLRRYRQTPGCLSDEPGTTSHLHYQEALSPHLQMLNAVRKKFGFLYLLLRSIEIHTVPVLIWKNNPPGRCSDHPFPNTVNPSWDMKQRCLQHVLNSTASATFQFYRQGFWSTSDKKLMSIWNFSIGTSRAYRNSKHYLLMLYNDEVTIDNDRF